MPATSFPVSALILLVEQEVAERESIAKHITDAEFQAVEAHDIDEAASLLENQDVIRGIVTDAHVPGRIDG